MNPDPVPILLNPSAGTGAAGRSRARLEAELRRQGIPYELTVTTSAAHLRERTRELAARGGIVAGAGGDSTFLIMAEEILKTGALAALALVGLGSSNDIPAALGLETIGKACRAIRAGGRKRVDVGAVIEDGVLRRHFLGQANVGLGVAVNRYVSGLAARKPRRAKRQTLSGFAGIRKAYRDRLVPLPLRVETEDARAEGLFTAAVFANIPLWTSGKRIAPAALADDGLLDACLIGPCSMLRLARIYALAGRGRHTGEPEVRMLRAPEFAVRSETPFDIQADGEIIEADPAARPARTVVFRALPGALEIVA